MLDVLVIALFVLLGAGNAAPAETLTNGVAIDGPVRLSLTDDLTAPGLEALLSDEELRAERPLSWVLYNGSSVGRSVVYLGPTSSFRFRLTTLDAVVLPMTDYGKAITIGPRSLTKLSKNPAKRRGVAAGRGVISDFPRLVELFRFPSNGVYLFELQYWVWDSQRRTLALSTPLRLRVVKEADHLPAGTREPGKANGRR